MYSNNKKTTKQAGSPPVTPKPKKKPKSACLQIRLGTGEWHTYDPDVLEDSDWNDFQEECDESKKTIYLRINHLSLWPDEARFLALKLTKHLGSRCRLSFDAITHSDPFELVLSAMRKGMPMPRQRAMQRAAIEAAGLWYGDMPDEAASRIIERLGELGMAKPRITTLAKKIRGIVGSEPGSSGTVMDAHSAAVQFHDYLREGHGFKKDEPVLWYFQGDFYIWQGMVWERQEDRRFQAQVMRFLQKLGISNLTERFCRDVIAHLQGLALLDAWQESPPFEVAAKDGSLQIIRRRLIVFQSGAIDIDELLKNDGPVESFDIDSRYFHESVLPFDYLPEAECPLWLETIDAILPKEDKTDHRQDLLQEYMGYTLHPDCHQQKCLIFQGDGGNGKTTITEPWEAMLGEENVSSVRLDELGDKYRAWSLKGKRANFSGELPHLGTLKEAVFKRIVSGEAIEVERKFKDAVKLRTHAKLIVNTNDFPQVRDPTSATFDRMIIMPFEKRFRGKKNEDKHRVEKLKEELPGILLWSLVGLKRLLTKGRFTKCGKCEAARKNHRIDSDSVLQFVEECCESAKNYQVDSKSLYAVYRVWSELTGRKAVQESEFGKRLKRAKWIKTRMTIGNRPYVYKNRKISCAGHAYVTKARLSLSEVSFKKLL